MPGVVQHLDLRYGDQHAMTLITFQGGKPVFRDGKVGTGQGCCCDGCPLECPPSPTEWRIVDQDDDVWFMGDVLVNPGYVHNCKNPDYNCDQTRYILDDYFLMYGCSQPAGYRKDGQQTLRLQVLGCNGNQWTNVTERCGGGPFGTAARDTLFCSEDDSWFEPLHIYRPFYLPVVAPGACKCSTDPNTGLPVPYQDPNTGSTQCHNCGNTMAASSTGSGLAYLGHGDPVRFTNRVNGDGRNAWNWEDSEGRFPADIPWNFYWGDKDIVIAGDLWQWKDCNGAYQAELYFNSVTIENGATMSLSFNANSLTMNNGRLDTSVCLGQNGRMVATVGSAALNDNSEVLKATINCEGCEMNGSFVRSEGIINGPCTLNGSDNEGTINGDCSLNAGSDNSGTVNGGTVSFDASSNLEEGEVDSDVPVVFANGSLNKGTVDGDATFNDESRMTGGFVSGAATFNDDACVTQEIHDDPDSYAGSFNPDPPPVCSP